jgi:hypothetical protein
MFHLLRISFSLSPVQISRSFTTCEALEPERLSGMSNITVAWFIFRLMARSSLLFTRRTGPLAGKNVIRFGSEASRSRTLTKKAYSPRFKPVLIPPCSICFVPLLHTLVDVWVHLVALLTIDQLGDPKRVVFVPSPILNANKVANFPFYLARDLGRDARPQLAPASNPSATASLGARRTRS